MVEKNPEFDKLEVFQDIELAYARNGLDNTFLSFLYYDIPYLVFATKKNSIISYNLNNLSIVAEIKNAHDDSISNLRDYQ